jgi:hypothetical protein
MLPNYTIDEFKGIIALSMNRFDASDNFVAYERTYVNTYVNLLLGGKVYNEIKTTDKLKWTALFEEGSYINGYYVGFSTVLKYLIYFHIVRDDFTMSDVGAVINHNENSKKVSQYGIAKDRYNKAVVYLSEVYKYIDASVFEYTATTTDLGSGTFLIEIDAPTRTFLEDGEFIEVDKVLYPIRNHTVGVGVETFEVDVNATSFKYTPYMNVIKNQLDVIVL